MILYNISIIVEDSSHDELMLWVKTFLKETNYETTFLKMLENPHEGTTYCIQTTITNDADMIAFQEGVTQVIQSHIGSHHNGKAFIFDSKMEYLSNL